MRARSRIARAATADSQLLTLTRAASRNRSTVVRGTAPQDFALLCHSLAVRIDLVVDSPTTLETVRALLASLTEGWRPHSYDRDGRRVTLPRAASRNLSTEARGTAPQDFALLCHSLAVRIDLAVGIPTTLETVRALLAGLPDDWLLHFYDRDYDSPSNDPGAYVLVARHGDRFLFGPANYGWNGPSVKRSLEEMAQMLYRCRIHIDSAHVGHRVSEVYLERMGPLTAAEVAACRSKG